MNWKHASLIILLCLGFAANAQDNRLIRLQQACRQFDSALVTKDKVKLNLLLQEYCRIKHSNGLEETKQELLQHLSEGFLEYDEIVQDGEMKVFFDEELGHVNRNLCVKLKKIDDQLNVTNSGNDMRQESHTVPHPTALLERDTRVFLCDSANGIYTFDRFASYLNTLEIKGITEMQAFGSQLIYRNGDTLKAYDIKTLTLNTIPLPLQANFLQARIERNRMYLLFDDRLEIYKVANEK
jgi:hypothetical protein